MAKSRWFDLRLATASALTLVAASAFAGEITLYEHPGFQGRSMATVDALPNLQLSAFNDAASSVVVSEGTWEACTEPYFRGACAQLVPGEYGRLDSQLRGVVTSVRQVPDEPARVVIDPDAAVVAINAVPAPVVIEPAPVVVNRASRPVQVAASPIPNGVSIPAGPHLVLYQHTTAGIRAVELTSDVDDLGVRDFAASADAAIVSGGVWRLCDGDRGRGQCVEYSPGQYVTLGALDHRVLSAYLVAPAPNLAALVAVPPGRAVLYQNPNFSGPTAVIEHGRAPDLDWANFKNPAASLRVESGTWLVCSEIGYQGDCRVLDPGDYPVLSGMTGIASARPILRPGYGSR